MANITLTIPDNQIQRVIDALCGRARVTPSGANAKTVVINYVKSVVRRYEAEQSEVNNDISVT